MSVGNSPLFITFKLIQWFLQFLINILFKNKNERKLFWNSGMAYLKVRHKVLKKMKTMKERVMNKNIVIDQILKVK